MRMRRLWNLSRALMQYRDDLARRLHNYGIHLRTCGSAEGAQLTRELHHIDPNIAMILGDVFMHSTLWR